MLSPPLLRDYSANILAMTSTGAVRDAWDDILVWQLDSRHRPCNLVELMPRLQEHRRQAG